MRDILPFVVLGWRGIIFKSIFWKGKRTMSATIELPMIDQAAILNSRTGPYLVVEVPPEQEKSIRDALDTLSRMNERGSAQTILDALRTAAEQSYFWTPEWQAGEREAERDLAEGRTRTFDTMEEMLDFLNAQ